MGGTHGRERRNDTRYSARLSITSPWSRTTRCGRTPKTRLGLAAEILRVQPDGLVTVSAPSVASDLTRYSVPVDSHPP